MLNNKPSLFIRENSSPLPIKRNTENQNSRRKDFLVGGFLVAVGVCLGFIGAWAIVRACQKGCCHQHKRPDDFLDDRLLGDQSQRSHSVVDGTHPENNNFLPVLGTDRVNVLQRQFAQINNDDTPYDYRIRRHHHHVRQPFLRNGMIRRQTIPVMDLPRLFPEEEATNSEDEVLVDIEENRNRPGF